MKLKFFEIDPGEGYLISSDIKMVLNLSEHLQYTFSKEYRTFMQICIEKLLTNLI